MNDVERLPVLEAVDEGTRPMGDIVGAIFTLPFIGLILTHRQILDQREIDKANAKESGGGGHGGH
jgi:hypothetical protein